ncbi:hypothetical protein QWI17_23465 [Gilvimarinus sp. SDUM040013]|uniref:DUF6732 family protein n=1 Tax=Gilvimarinus gilvus TaxID=3058038 RepID=A0ABU4S0Y1_9GAMM|nr:DUF6732 family protein [Gilvimarinus sp. SDUM040013]MDO3388826.1 hypothetical protein [Gilvimarinus sp. SDUM040013]MDX6850579.1 DUF6732 family protein [Gilvimarinus sp. SDUM040013]
MKNLIKAAVAFIVPVLAIAAQAHPHHSAEVSDHIHFSIASFALVAFLLVGYWLVSRFLRSQNKLRDRDE